MKALYIGRFEPPHDGHLGSMLRALERHDRLHLLLGSANLARSSKNPWSAAERARLIRRSLTDGGVDPRRVRCSPLPDEFDALRWAAQVRRLAGRTVPVLVGFEKDASSSYLRWFPDWPADPSPLAPGLNATEIRAAYFEGRAVPGVPPAVGKFLERWKASATYTRLRAEHLAVQAARRAWNGQPQREVLTVDVNAGQVRLARRTQPIGRGLWALPSTALPPGRDPPPQAQVFDHPARSLAVPTTAYAVQGEAGSGEWVPLEAALRQPRRFFEDHHVILRRMLERLRLG
ncbi:ADP-ribose pyrophosphatase [Deinococcus irradiatisoli]|uniref:ADP-ribose pyrophosphatase n=1 Tax=Deinococcus irradiatisoli TaxID=2202254 RepID=A0A2Z3JK51_9DEIO|nr:adenylyltransferase/cytidyltransferase family protein [Deinococcus irradiatisoli]AWN24236.1 ADP-ribose pyrophosphatase [Deinococcus irradiatisoli]